MGKRLLVSLACLVTLASCDTLQASTTGTERRQFVLARELVTRGQYEAAIPALQQYLNEHPRGKDASRAAFFIAKAHLGAGRYEEAKSGFARTIQDFPRSLEAHKSQYKLGLVAFLEGDRLGAAEAFKRLVDTPNGGPLAPEATAFTRYLEQGQRE
jgi:TolA-binding protein